MPYRVISHTPCRSPAILRQRRVLNENPRGSRKYPNCYSYSLTDWYASDNLRGSPRGSRRKPKAGRSPTCRLWTVNVNPHMPRYTQPALMPCCAVALRTRFQNGMVVAWYGCGVGCVNQKRPHCVNQMGMTQSKLLAARERYGVRELT
jgi:hypothetical protein